jgi:hypothetical protein
MRKVMYARGGFLAMSARGVNVVDFLDSPVKFSHFGVRDADLAEGQAVPLMVEVKEDT